MTEGSYAVTETTLASNATTAPHCRHTNTRMLTPSPPYAGLPV